jgi:SAM-dependent methyltransferase
VHEYDLIADWYAAERRDTTGVPEVQALSASLRANSRILDIGCGNGIPLTSALLRAGHRVVGLDSSARMLGHFRRNCPATPAVRAIAQSCPFLADTFDAAIAWGMMFHLPQPEEVKVIACVSRLLKPGSPFLFTSGDDDGVNDDFVGTMNGVTFHYYSFTAKDYERVLEDHGLRLLQTHADEGQNFYYLCQKLG